MKEKVTQGSLQLVMSKDSESEDWVDAQRLGRRRGLEERTWGMQRREMDGRILDSGNGEASFSLNINLRIVRIIATPVAHREADRVRRAY